MWKKGDEVLARRENDERWLKGIIRFIKGENIYIEFADGVFELATEVRDLRSPPKPETELHLPPYVTGDRILGRWLDLWWYPATILFLDKGRYHVQFDDGDRGALLETQMLPLQVEVGDRVQCRPKFEPRLVYKVGTITRVAGEIIDVEYEDGEQETNTSISRIRLWRCPAPVEGFTFNEGDRVLGWGPDNCWYPADILTIDGDWIVLQYLLGVQGVVTPELIRPVEMTVGTRVEGRWRGGDIFFPGVVDEERGDRIHIKYDDGDEEWTTVRLIRVPDPTSPAAAEAAPTATPPAESPPAPAGSGGWKVGDRVLALWEPNGLWYAGTIRGGDGDRFHVVFDNGDQSWVTQEQLTALELPSGTAVLAPRSGSYAPAEVRHFDGVRVQLRYDDGTEETVEVRRICLLRTGQGHPGR